MLEGKALELVYDMGKEMETTALRSVEIQVSAGEMIGIMGPSGSGKSSLISVLSGLRRPSAGAVFYQNQELDSLSEVALAQLRRRDFGFVFQRLHLIEYLSVLDNVQIAALDRGKAGTTYAQQLLEALKLSHVAGNRPSQLSGGQKQRVAIARALVNHPSVIFADEPTASLDHRNAMEVVRLLRSLNPEAGIVLVTHDRSILDGADRILELWDGRLLP